VRQALARAQHTVGANQALPILTRLDHADRENKRLRQAEACAQIGHGLRGRGVEPRLDASWHDGGPRRVRAKQADHVVLGIRRVGNHEVRGAY
jgi:hypothetical protein